MARKGIWKVENLTLRLLPLIAALLLLSVVITSINDPMARSMSTILGITATILLIVGVLISEAMSKKVPEMLKWGIFLIALLVILAIVPPLAGITVPFLTQYAWIIEAVGALLAFLLMLI
jgi:hypothetical protein